LATIGAFAILFDEHRRVLCVKMNYGSRRWTTPGGRVEPGESPTEALKREVLEESGYVVEAGAFIGVYSKPYEDDIVLSFHTRIIRREAWQPNAEITEARYFAISELPAEMDRVVRARILDAVNGVQGVYRLFETRE
jgi:8-oxo-dGTP pyrophosphatase MutT (NUDIX family)